MNLFDLHSDTPSKMFERRAAFDDPEIDVSIGSLKTYDKVRQVFAIWSDSRFSDDEAYARAFKILDHFEASFPSASSVTPIYAIEDARLLAGDLSRLDALHERGIRIITLTWSGTSCIGGSHNTDDPLTEFGVKTVNRALERGITIDISHASREVIREVSLIAREHGAPFIASHSNSYSVTPHTRNLTDDDFKSIVEAGGLVGICFYPSHLSVSGKASISDVLDHIEKYLSLGGEKCICIGSDFDGIDSFPQGLRRASDSGALFDAMLGRGFSAELANDIMFGNAERFYQRNIIKNINI